MRNARGVTMVEILAALLGVGILVALAVPLYLGYLRDARLAEARAIAGSTLGALRSCVVAKGGDASCSLAEIGEGVGVSRSGLSADARWHITRATLTPISRNPLVFSGLIAVAGRAKDTADTALAMFESAAGIAVRCSTSSSVPPMSPSEGEAC
jgi:type II secretory pathway pseudopilin PulG